MSSPVDQFRRGEWCGDPEEVRAQQSLASARPWLAAQKRLLSQGRTLLVFDGHGFDPPLLTSLVEKFGRVLVHAKASGLPRVSEALRADGAEVNELLHLVCGERARVLERVEAIVGSRGLPPGWTFGGVDTAAPSKLVKSIQSLHRETGVTPLPGGFVRGEGVEAHTVVLYDARGATAGCATVQNLSGRDSSFDGAAMVLGVCLRADARGRGLSPLLNGLALSHGLREFDAARVYELIEEGNLPSLRMNEACGLETIHTDGFVFASLRAG
jgi:hypothetical protein